MKNIKAFIFDFGGVIIDDPSEGIMNYCLKELNITKEQISSINLKKDLNNFQRGIISEKQFWENIFSKLNIKSKTDIKIWGKALKSTFFEKQEIINIIKKIKNSGLKIGLITNTEKPNEKIIKDQNYPFFDVEIYSCYEGLIKPDSDIYNLALERLDVKPEEAVFIDDKEENILGAKKVGINTILFDNSLKVIKKINKLI